LLYSLPARHSHRQGFGKARNRIGMPKAKKKKVVLVDEEAEDVGTNIFDEAVEEERTRSTDVIEQEPVSVDVPESPGKQKRAAAASDLEFALNAAAECRVELSMALADLEVHERLQQVKFKRWDAAEKKKERPSALSQLEKMYKMQLADLKVRAKVTEARLAAEDASNTYHMCLANVKTLEINRLWRELRRYKPHRRSVGRSRVSE
jgi:hypothetical protein